MYSLIRPEFRIGLAVVALAVLWCGGPASAQMRPQPPIVIQNATIWTMAGERLEGGTILIAGKKIRAIGREVEVPRFARVIDGTGMTVIPGIIDAMSAVSLAPEAQVSRRGRPTTLVNSRVLDGIDPYERHEVEEAIRNGVTCVYLSPHGEAGICGLGAVVKLMPGTPLEDRVVVEEAALCASLGSGPTLLPILRMRELKTVRELLKGAKQYKEAWDEYEEALEEYTEKIEERQKEAAKDAKPGEKKPGDAPPEKKDPEKKGPEKEPPKDEPPKDEPPKDEPPKDEPPAREVSATAVHPDLHIEEDPEPVDTEDHDRHEGETFPFAQEGESEPEKKEDDKGKKKDDLEKPKEPQIDRAKALLVRALEGKIPVRIEAHRAEDLVNALELAREYPMKLVLEGATEAYKVRDAIRDAKVPVVLGETVRRDRFENGKFRGNSPDAPSLLHDAGVVFAIASGGEDALESRFLWAAAGIAASHGLDPEAALAAVTREAAKILGIEDRVGTLEEGKDADLVLLSGSPFAGDTVVQAVLVDGKIVYEKK